MSVHQGQHAVEHSVLISAGAEVADQGGEAGGQGPILELLGLLDQCLPALVVGREAEGVQEGGAGLLGLFGGVFGPGGVGGIEGAEEGFDVFCRGVGVGDVREAQGVGDVHEQELFGAAGLVECFAQFQNCFGEAFGALGGVREALDSFVKGADDGNQQVAGKMWENNDAVFSTENGRWVVPDNLNRALKNLIGWTSPDKGQASRGGMGTECLARIRAVTKDRKPLPHLTPHDLRHIHTTLALSKGAPLATVSHRLGHSKVSITLDVYRHILTSEEQHPAIDILES